MIVTIATIAALTGSAGCTGTGDRSSSSSTYTDGGTDGSTETTSYTVDQPVGTINLNARAGKVTVTAGDGPVSVTERAVYTDSKPVTSHQLATGGDTLFLREEGCPERAPAARCQVSWDITAPAGTVLELENRVGGIELRGMAGAVRAEADTGGVQGRELTSRRVTATAKTGGVELDFASPPDQVTAETNTGGVQIRLPSGTAYAVDVDSRKAEIDVRRDPASPHAIRAKADTGGVEITSR